MGNCGWTPPLDTNELEVGFGAPFRCSNRQHDFGATWEFELRREALVESDANPEMLAREQLPPDRTLDFRYQCFRPE